MCEMDTDICDTLTSPEGLQDWFTDLDGWVCRFDARFSLSRSHPKCQETNLSQTCRNCTKESTENKNLNTQPSPDKELVKTQPSSESLVTLHEVIVNGLLITQKRKQRENKDKTDILDIFKVNDDFTHYDYVLMTTVQENGRKQMYKYILRSKI